MESYSRVRSVKLRRPGPDAPFGFSVRGGHEHGTGIFVSFVDPRSIAFKQGLKVGDQILRVSGFPVSAAVHHECLSLMRVRPSLHLKVRSVGMLPVKERTGDPLTWKLVEEQPTLELVGGRGGGSRLSDTSSHSQPDPQNPTEAKVYIHITGNGGLGCCICKGPPERPGIFVQSTKSNGVAREAGLRPGDQILSCNGHSFLHIPFAEAVHYLKNSQQLKLRVLKGAATDLFPGESSGYNSSASSLNGDLSPHEHDSSSSHGSATSVRRPNNLASVTEELSNSKNKHHPKTEGGGGSKSKQVPLDRRMEWDEVEQVWRSAERETIVIEVRGAEHHIVGGTSTMSSTTTSNGTTTHTLAEEEQRLAETQRQLEETKQRLLQEAIRLEDERRKLEEEKRALHNLTLVTTTNNSNGSNFTSHGESGGGPEVVDGGKGGHQGLAGALHQEILKRHERRESSGVVGGSGKEDERPKPGTVEQKRSLFNSQINQETRQQHEQLIEEFKRAHRKMFAHTLEEDAATSGKDGATDSTPVVSAPALLIRKRRVQKAMDHERQMVAQRVVGIVRQRQFRIERQHQECAETEREIRSKSPPPPPPPPPPMPNAVGPLYTQKNSKPSAVKKMAPSIPINTTTTTKLQTSAALQVQTKKVIIEERPKPGQLQQAGVGSYPQSRGKGPPPPPPTVPTRSNGNLTNDHNKPAAKTEPERSGVAGERRPESPSPDYSNTPSPTAPRARTGRMGVDMQSLESFKLKDPPPRSPKKPPPVYFSHNNPQIIQSGRLAGYKCGTELLDPSNNCNSDVLNSHTTNTNNNNNGPVNNMRNSTGITSTNGNGHTNGGILKFHQAPSSASPKTISFD